MQLIKKMNDKGYMLIEIILAFAIAFGLAYFITNLTIKLKNKNDDLMIETLITTDQAIITNKLMDYAKFYEDDFNCGAITYEGNIIKYGDDVIDIVNEYTTINTEETSCLVDDGKITIDIPLVVPQIPDKEYNVKLEYKYRIGDQIPPTIGYSGTALVETNCGKAEFTLQGDDDGSGYAYMEVTIKKGDTIVSGYDKKKITTNSSGKISLTTAGDYKLFASSYDNAGNVSNELYKEFKIIDTSTFNSELYSYGGYATFANGNKTIYLRGNSSNRYGTYSLKINCPISVDIFVVGGGGGSSAANGGGGGYTKTFSNHSLTAGNYNVRVGQGGAVGADGSSSGLTNQADNAWIKDKNNVRIMAYGGKTSTANGYGGNGGSGGEGNFLAMDTCGAPGSDGGNGQDIYAEWADDHRYGGKGQKNTAGPNGETGSTREFGESTGTLYSGGGATGKSNHLSPDDWTSCPGGSGGGGATTKNGTANTGGGGGGLGGAGGSGIVVIRIRS